MDSLIYTGNLSNSRDETSKLAILRIPVNERQALLTSKKQHRPARGRAARFFKVPGIQTNRGETYLSLSSFLSSLSFLGKIFDTSATMVSMSFSCSSPFLKA